MKKAFFIIFEPNKTIFLEVESPTLETFNIYNIIMINSVLFLSLLLILDLTQQAAMVNFMLFLNILKILKISF